MDLDQTALSILERQDSEVVMQQQEELRERVSRIFPRPDIRQAFAALDLITLYLQDMGELSGKTGPFPRPLPPSVESSPQ